MTTKIRKTIESSLASMQRARCTRRVGALLATIPLPLAALRLIPDQIVNDMLPWFDRMLALEIVVAVIVAGIVLYVIGVALFANGKLQIARALRGSRGFVRIAEPAADLVARLRTLGARGATADTFVSSETLTLLIDNHPDNVQAWGKPAKMKTPNGHERIDYQDTCFFVIAPLKSVGVNAMLPDDYGLRRITRNRELKAEHIEKLPKRCVGLYIIELYGESKTSRGAAAGKLFTHLNDGFGSKLADAAFHIFARPATTDGIRVVKHYSFRNLGTGPNDMHVWQALEEDHGLCGLVLSLFIAK